MKKNGFKWVAVVLSCICIWQTCGVAYAESSEGALQTDPSQYQQEEVPEPENEESEMKEETEDNIELPEEEQELPTVDSTPEEPPVEEASEEASGEEAPEEEMPILTYRVHGQTYGWQNWRQNGEQAGSVGSSKRLEAIQIRLEHPGCEGTIEYRTHVQTYGWQDWRSNGEIAGTTGESKRMEAFAIRLTGELAEKYDIYYRGHCQTFGWLNWTSNGQMIGTEGFVKRMEAIEIRLVKKGEPVQESTDGSGAAFLRTFRDQELCVSGHVQSIGDVTGIGNGGTLGTTGQSKRLEGICIDLDQSSGEVLEGELQYRTHQQAYGWSDWVSQGIYSGTKGESKRLEAIQIRLTGELEKYYNIYYRAHIQKYGWLGWASNGQMAGSSGLSYRVEALQIKLVPKGVSGPNTSASSYVAGIPAQSGGSLSVFNSTYKMSDSVKTRLDNAIAGFTSSGKRVGFVMVDLMTGEGIYYNSGQSFYSASAIKGPYVVSLNEKVPSSASAYGGVMRNTIKVSSNTDYASLRRIYGGNYFNQWLQEAGCSNVNAYRNYTDITPRDLAQMWVKSYQYFTSGKANASFCRNLFTGTLNSPISNSLGGKYIVYSKAGWIGSGGYYNVQNDGGIVMRSGHPYAVVILSTAYGRLDLMNNMVKAIDATHEEMIQ